MAGGGKGRFGEGEFMCGRFAKKLYIALGIVDSERIEQVGEKGKKDMQGMDIGMWTVVDKSYCGVTGARVGQ